VGSHPLVRQGANPNGIRSLDPEGNKLELWEPMIWNKRTKVSESLATLSPNNSFKPTSAAARV
jgi:hypothetical protein